MSKGDSMGKLDGKVAIVTGAARGLGRAYARRLADLGARVAVTDLDLQSYGEFEAERAAMNGSTTVEEIRAEGGEALGFEFDVGDRTAVFDMVADVKRAWGRVDVLVANAGGGRGTTQETKASEVDPELMELVVRMNLYGTYHCCSAVAPVMKAQESGRIVTVASYAGSVAGPSGGYAHYGAAKAAIAHYSRYLAQELGPYNINVNCIAPGFIGTGRIMAKMQDESGTARAAPKLSDQIALRRYGTPEDCAKVIEFLATDLSDYVTGALIPIDGGWNRAG
jgi:3-oxoacyl-[acyl-carrier protein] reductase